MGWFAAMPGGWIQNPLLRLAEFLGIRSYTIYIYHFPLITILAAAWIQFNGSRPLHGWLAFFGVAVTLFVCLVLFHFIECRFLHARLSLHPSNV